MIRISCPYCGTRDHSEFSYEGDATIKRPSDETPAGSEWYDYIYYRDNPRGEHQELWQHASGCRAFLKVVRNTATHEVLSVEPVVKTGEER